MYEVVSATAEPCRTDSRCGVPLVLNVSRTVSPAQRRRGVALNSEILGPHAATSAQAAVSESRSSGCMYPRESEADRHNIATSPDAVEPWPVGVEAKAQPRYLSCH